jgi:hypothetical protein
MMDRLLDNFRSVSQQSKTYLKIGPGAEGTSTGAAQPAKTTLFAGVPRTRAPRELFRADKPIERLSSILSSTARPAR